MLITNSIKWDILCLIITILVIIIAKHVRMLGYWKRRGVLSPKSVYFFGNMKDIFLGRTTVFGWFKDTYLEFKSQGARYFGIYMFGSPVFVPIDLELTKAILKNNFENFYSHGFYYNEKTEPVSVNIFNLDGPRWREIRSKVTPIFTPIKIKSMYETLTHFADDLDALLEKRLKSNPVNFKEIMSFYAIDVIGSLAFGQRINSMNETKVSEFKINGDKIMEPGWNNFKFAISLMLNHDILRYFGFTQFDNRASKFYCNTITSNVKHREENNIFRNDYLDLLIEAKNSKDESKRLTPQEVIGQCFIFYIGGFDNFSTALNFLTFEIAKNQKIQDLLREEINSVMNKHNNEITYEAMQELHYMNQVIQESFRKYPNFPLLLRKCTKDFKIPGEELVIEKGTSVFIPVSGIHYDPEYYQNPDEFVPERFDSKNKRIKSSYQWLPFGEGHRVCIGMRFAIEEIKIGLTTLLKKYKLRLNEKTKLPLELTRKCLPVKCDEGIWIDLEKLDN
ncbi:unnamed protein product [Phyllotreta striolata]|uniref:Cytochrome P450 n=1 Tax=Phyllotreta striolata TaxID=444603 RepID=A0A9N9XRV8_PHYSR|nr:unnamed protein product [Phyllotreta striolata]